MTDPVGILTIALALFMSGGFFLLFAGGIALILRAFAKVVEASALRANQIAERIVKIREAKEAKAKETAKP